MHPRLHQTPTSSPASPPEEAARLLRGKEGFVFLDSSLAGAGALSILAHSPQRLVQGGPAEWPRLEEELRLRSRPTADTGLPEGAAIGWVNFDGSFRFGFYDSLHVYLHDFDRWINPPPSAPVPRPVATPPLNFQPLVPREDFLAALHKVHAYIAAGDIYQVCLSHPFVAEFSGDAWPYYESLRHYSPAPHGAFLDLDGTQVASASPECFLRMSGRRITTRPIKGTRPRRSDPQLDQRNAFDLLTSPKEVAELVMITDLERNDLGRVCEYGSVTVPELLKLESFEQVHHLVSTVTGTLREDVSHAAALRASFPGGSISGAPKKRALEIIAELEPHPRGLYTGAIGYFGYNGESQFSIAIRTAIFENDRAQFHAGAGIVADSVAENEWQETLDKAAGLLLAAQRMAGRAN